MQEKILIISGYSNSSKDSVLNILVNKHRFNSLISHTSRAIRPSEVNGREYFFTTKEDFLNKANNGYFVETRVYFTNVAGKSDVYYYGISKQQVDKINKPSCIILDKQGVQEFAKYVGEDNIILVYFEINKEVARQRNIKRGDYDETEFERRWNSDKKSFKGIEDMAHRIIPTDKPLEEVVNDVLEIYEYYS